MILKLLNKVKLYFNPPQIGETYYGDVVYFVIGKPMEYILHGLKDKNGNTIFDPIPSQDCYRLTIETTLNDYYRCYSEVFCKSIPKNRAVVGGNNIGYWMKRTQFKKIPKSYFEEMIANGILKRGVRL